MFKKIAVAAIAALIVPITAQAQLTDTNTPDCAFSNIGSYNWGTNISYVSCFGSVAGNNEGNASPGETATLNQINTSWGGLYGPFSTFATSQTNAGDASGAGPFAAFATNQVSGTLTFDNPQFGYFVLGLKASDSFSLYLLRSTAPQGALTVNFKTDGTSLNNSGKPQGLSHASLYQGDGGPGVQCVGGICTTIVPEPSTYALMASGLLGIFGLARRRRNNA